MLLVAITVVLGLLLLYIYAQVTWKERSEAVPVETAPSTERYAEERQAIIEQTSPRTDSTSAEERAEILSSGAEAGTSGPEISTEERRAILNQ